MLAVGMRNVNVEKGGDATKTPEKRVPFGMNVTVDTYFKITPPDDAAEPFYACSRVKCWNGEVSLEEISRIMLCAVKQFITDDCDVGFCSVEEYIEEVGDENEEGEDVKCLLRPRD